MELIVRILSSPVWQGVGVILAVLFGLVGFYTSGTIKDRRWLYSALIIVLIIIAFGGGAEVQRQSTSTGTSSGTVVPIAVDAKQGVWQPTGVTVSEGQTITIMVTGGGWTVSREKVPDNINKNLPSPFNEGNEAWEYFWAEKQGNGFGDLCENSNCPLQNQSTGALVARIGNVRYLINQRCTFTVASSGNIFLRMNDANYDDNGGALAVNITVESSDNPNISSNCGIPIR